LLDGRRFEIRHPNGAFSLVAGGVVTTTVGSQFPHSILLRSPKTGLGKGSGLHGFRKSFAHLVSAVALCRLFLGVALSPLRTL